MERVVCQQGDWTPISPLHGKKGNLGIDRAGRTVQVGIPHAWIHTDLIGSSEWIADFGSRLHEPSSIEDLARFTSNSPANPRRAEIINSSDDAVRDSTGEELLIFVERKINRISIGVTGTGGRVSVSGRHQHTIGRNAGPFAG